MKVLLDIEDDKALQLLEVLKGLSDIKILEISDSKAELLSEIKEASGRDESNTGGQKKGSQRRRFSQ